MLETVKNPTPMDTTSKAPKRDQAASEAEKQNYREVPYNIDAEQMVLGAILTNNEAYHRVSEILQPRHFYTPIHGLIYEEMVNVLEKGLTANPVTLKGRFDREEALQDMGGASYLAQLAGLASGIVAVKDYARIIHDYYLHRELIDIGEEMVDDSYHTERGNAASTVIEQTEQKLFQLASEGDVERQFAPLKKALQDSLDRANRAFQIEGAINGVPTELNDLDKMLGGFQDSDLVILAARPSMGKTALALNMALKGAEFFHREGIKELQNDPTAKPKSVGFYSLEMSAEQLAARLLSLKTGINANSIRRGKLQRGQGRDEFEELVHANKELYQMPFFIDDTPALSISAIRTRARRLKRKSNLGLLIIDYLQLIRGVSAQSATNRVQEISEITMGLKAIAKELNIPVIALSQLSRQVESRDDKRPQLSDLRESGSIEQDADIVMFIYREAYYVERKKPSEGTEQHMEWQAKMDQVNNIAEIMVAKHRNGPVGSVSLFFDGNTTRFGNLASDQYLPDHE